MAVHSLMQVPSSSSSTGTVAVGFFSAKAGSLCSPRGTSIETKTTLSESPFSASAMRTRVGFGKPL